MKLVKFLMKLKNETVTVELKNGSAATGVVTAVDIKMNVHLTGVRLVPRRGAPAAVESYSVRGSQIRHIALPDYLPLEAMLVDDPPRRAATGAARPKRKIKKGRE